MFKVGDRVRLTEQHSHVVPGTEGIATGPHHGVQIGEVWWLFPAHKLALVEPEKPAEEPTQGPPIRPGGAPLMQEPRGCPTPGACSCPDHAADLAAIREEIWRWRRINLPDQNAFLAEAHRILDRIFDLTLPPEYRSRIKGDSNAR